MNISLNMKKQVYPEALAKNEGLAKPRCFILPDKIDRKCSWISAMNVRRTVESHLFPAEASKLHMN
jgi:hypothetical protein